MFLITSVVYECYMISRLYIKNICCFQKFLNFSQNYVYKLTLQPLSLSLRSFSKRHLDLSFILLKL